MDPSETTSAWSVRADGLVRASIAPPVDGEVLWVHVVGDEVAAEAVLHGVVGPDVPPLVVRLRVPRVERPDEQRSRVHLVELGVLATAHVVVTWAAAEPRADWTAWLGRVAPEVAAGGGGALLVGILEQCVARYVAEVEQIDRRLDEYEALVLNAKSASAPPGRKDVGRVVHESRGRLAATRGEARRMELEVADLLDGDDPILGTSRKQLHRVRHRVTLLLEEIEETGVAAAALLDLHYARAGYEMNEIMKVLTLASTVLLPASLIAGIYGMNFHIPELGWKHGYAYSLALMAVFGAVQVVAFRMRGWL